MEHTIWMLGGDVRSRWAAEHLKQSGLAVKTYGVPELTDCPLPEKFVRVVLPFPSFEGAYLHGAAKISVEELLCRANGSTRVYGARFGIWRHGLESRGAQVTDLYDSEPLTTANAALTAEGALEVAMQSAPIALLGSNCLVIGCGRIGKLLAQKLHALQANVTVAARKPADRALAEAYGFRSDETGLYRRGLRSYDFIFNTVPAAVLSDTQLQQLSRTCVYIELASAPYGCSAEACQALGVSHRLAAGLPGRFSPKTAGILYAKSLLQAITS